MAATVTSYSRVFSSKLLQVKSPGKLKIVLLIFWFTCSTLRLNDSGLQFYLVIVDLVCVYYKVV